jgi:hypothetical protein
LLLLERTQRWGLSARQFNAEKAPWGFFKADAADAGRVAPAAYVVRFINPVNQPFLRSCLLEDAGAVPPRPSAFVIA